MSIVAVNYEYDATKLDALAQHRPEHRAFLKSLFDQDVLLASGPLGSNGALITLRADSTDAALKVLDSDPLLLNGIVETRVARTWNPVIGPWD